MGKSFTELNKPLRVISLDLTEGCSLRCKYCFQDFKSEKKENRKLTEKIMKDTVDWLFDDKTSGYYNDINKNGGLLIEFWGGEPLHNWDMLVKTTEYQNEKSRLTGKNVKFGGTTNQVEFTVERIQYLYDNNVNLLISYDGVNNDKYRIFPDGSGSSDIILKNIDLYYDVFNRSPSVRMSLHPDYIDTLYESYEIMLSKGVRNYFFSPVFEQVWTEEHLVELKNQLLKIYNKEQKLLNQGFPPLKNKFVDEMINLIIDSKKINVDLDNDEEVLSTSREKLMKIQPNNSNRPCGQGVTYFGISIDGQIYICHRFNKHGLDQVEYPYEQRFGRMGSIYTDIENIDMFNKLNQWNVDEIEHCKNCKFKYFCNGGCYQANYDTTGDVQGQVNYQCKIKFTLYDAQKEILKIYEKQGIYDKANNKLNINYNKGNMDLNKFTREFNTCHCYNGAYLVKDVEDVLQNLKVDKDTKNEVKLQLAKQGIETAMDLIKELENSRKLDFKI